MAFPDEDAIVARKSTAKPALAVRVTMRLLLIGCGLLVRELSDAIVRSPHLIDATYLPACLHDTGAKSMRRRLQEQIDAADTSQYDAIVFGYALCGTGLAGLRPGHSGGSAISA